MAYQQTNMGGTPSSFSPMEINQGDTLPETHRSQQNVQTGHSSADYSADEVQRRFQQMGTDPSYSSEKYQHIRQTYAGSWVQKTAGQCITDHQERLSEADRSNQPGQDRSSDGDDTTYHSQRLDDIQAQQTDDGPGTGRRPQSAVVIREKHSKSSRPSTASVIDPVKANQYPPNDDLKHYRKTMGDVTMSKQPLEKHKRQGHQTGNSSDMQGLPAQSVPKAGSTVVEAPKDSSTTAIEATKHLFEALTQKHHHCYSDKEVEEMGFQFSRILDQTIAEHKKEKDKMEKEYKKEIDHLCNRLSSEMNSKISANETIVENISIKSRPMKIAEDYGNMCSNDWLTAKEYLDEKYTKTPDLTKFQFLCSIIKWSGQVASNLQIESQKRMHQYISDPLNEYGGVQSATLKELPLEVQNASRDIFRRMADQVDVDPIVTGMQQSMYKDNPNLEPVLKDKTILVFMDKCAVLAWKMVNQKPPMAFSESGLGGRFDGQCQEPQWGSSDPKDPRSYVVCYVWPILTHGSKTLVKGKVYLQLKDKH